MVLKNNANILGFYDEDDKISVDESKDENINMSVTFVKHNDRRNQPLLIDSNPDDLYYNPFTKTLHADNFSGGIASLIAGEAIQLTTVNNSTEIDVNFSKNTEAITTFDNADTFLASNSSNALKTITGLNLSNQLRSGLCPLNSNNIIPNQYLPGSVSDILEVANFAALPTTGDSSKIYVTLDNHKAYRWGGSSYVEISASLVIGTTAGTAYDGASGQTNANAIANKQATITPGSNLSFSGDTLNVDSALTGITSVQATSNDLEIKTTTNNEIQFKTNNTERLSIDSTKLDSTVDINIPINKHYQINGVDVLHNTGSSTNIILNAKFIQNAVSPYDGLYINYLAGTTTTSHCRLYAGNTTPRMMIKADTGKIGIATESPSEILDVVGNIKCSGVYKGDGSELTGIDDTTYLLGNNLSFNTATTPHTINLNTTLTGLSSVTSTEIIGGDGTAGIVGQLQIVRPFTQSDTTHYISCVRQGSAIFGIGYHAGGGNKIYLANTAANNSTTTGFTIDSNKIGINQVNPTQALDVNGNVYIAGDCNLSSGSKYKMNGTELSGANLNYSAGVTLNTKIDTKQPNITFGKNNGNALKLQENVATNDILLMGSSNVIGKTYSELKSLLQITDTTYLLGNNLSFNTATTPHTINLDTSLTSMSKISSSAGNFELGSENQMKFYSDENGNNGGGDFVWLTTKTNGGSPQQLMKITGSTGNAEITGSLTATSGTFSGTLEVTGNIKKGTVDVIYGNPTNPYINVRVLQNISTANQDGMFINYNSTGSSLADIKFYANGTTERMRITASTGNVGIGKTAASNRKLDVDGAISSESGYKLNGISCLFNQGTEEGTGPYLNARVIANNSSLNDDGLHLNFGSTGTTAADIRLYDGSNVVKARLDATDGTFQVVEPLMFNPPNGMGSGTFTATPNIKIGSAYMFPLSGTSQTFERLMSFTKIGNMLSINGFFVMNVNASTGQTYMNLADLGLPLGVNTGVYPMTSQSTFFNSSITTDTSANRLVFNWASSSNGIKYGAVKFLIGCGFRASY